MPTVFTFTHVVYLAEKQQVSALVFGLVGHKKKKKIYYCTQGEHAKHYTTERQAC
jgi:hypothetical protein